MTEIKVGAGDALVGFSVTAVRIYGVPDWDIKSPRWKRRVRRAWSWLAYGPRPLLASFGAATEQLPWSL